MSVEKTSGKNQQLLPGVTVRKTTERMCDGRLFPPILTNDTCIETNQIKTLSGGSLGSRVDEERGQTR